MMTLEQYNEMRRMAYLRMNGESPKGNGIQCPKCNSELLDSNPMLVLTSNPPQKNVHCEKCGYRGYRVA